MSSIAAAHWANYSGETVKRLIDIAASALGLACLAPLLVLVSIAIKMESQGAVFSLQACRGRHGRTFYLFQFRTSCLSHKKSCSSASETDQATTHLGAALRMSGIERIPRLFNVLRGEMSIVGPRPRALSETSSDPVSILGRVKPGIVGWAQANGYKASEPTITEMKEAYELDRWYIDHQSLSLDLLVIWRTLKGLFEKHDSLQHSGSC